MTRVQLGFHRDQPKFKWFVATWASEDDTAFDSFETSEEMFRRAYMLSMALGVEPEPWSKRTEYVETSYRKWKKANKL